MEKIKQTLVFNFLNGKDLKTRILKLSIVLLFMSLGFFSNICVYIAFALSAIFIAFEFSMDSIMWVVLVAIYMRNTIITFIIMWEMVVILSIKFIIDLKNKRINCRNWRFIAIVSLFVVMSLLMLLPVSKVYYIFAQLKSFALFALVVLGLLYVKQINIKQFLILLPLSVIVLCCFYYIFSLFDLVKIGYFALFSFGIVGRFDTFCSDPNFTAAILICNLMCWFIAYKKNFINKVLYFAILSLFGMFLLMTISKAAFLVVGLFALYVLIENITVTIKNKNSKNLLELCYYSIALIIACVVCWQYLDAIIQRLLNPGEGWWSNGNNALSNLTTGRFDLWIMYLKAIVSSGQVFLFGFGVYADIVGPGAAHSTPLDYVYRYGVLVSAILLAIFVIAVIPYLKKVKTYNLIPIICITCMYCSIGSISPKYIYVFVIVFLTLCCNGIQHRYIKN